MKTDLRSLYQTEVVMDHLKVEGLMLLEVLWQCEEACNLEDHLQCRMDLAVAATLQEVVAATDLHHLICHPA